MPFMAIYRADISPEDYATFRAKVPLDRAPQGALVHTYARDGQGQLVCVDVWESPEALATFGAEVVAPAIASLGLPPIQPEILELRTLAAFKEIARHEIARVEPALA